MSIGTTIDGEPNVACQALALKRALVQLVSDAGLSAIAGKTMVLLQIPVDYSHMQKYGGGVTAHAATRTQPGSQRVQIFSVSVVENHLADIDNQLKALGGS